MSGNPNHDPDTGEFTSGPGSDDPYHGAAVALAFRAARVAAEFGLGRVVSGGLARAGVGAAVGGPAGLAIGFVLGEAVALGIDYAERQHAIADHIRRQSEADTGGLLR